MAQFAHAPPDPNQVVSVRADSVRIDSGQGARPLRVLHVNPERGYSGGEVQVLGLIRGLANLGAEQWLAGYPGGPALAAAEEAGVNTLHSGMRGDLDLGAVVRLRRAIVEPVSYTHLTLPTIYSV